MIPSDKRLYVDLTRELHERFKRGKITKERYMSQYRINALNWHRLRTKEMEI